jgi:protein gp88
MQSNKRVTISRGNRKLGAIMNVSTEPVQCCLKGIPCAEGGCYALKSLRQYPQTRKAWAKNARIAKTNPRSYFAQIANRIAVRRPRRFRWHVAGDILSVDYLRQMCRVAAQNLRTSFLVFTKAFNIVNAYESTRALPSKFGGDLLRLAGNEDGQSSRAPHRLDARWNRKPSARGCSGVSG